VALDDVRQAQIRMGLNKRRVKHLPRQAETDQTHVDARIHAGILSRSGPDSKSRARSRFREL